MISSTTWLLDIEHLSAGKSETHDAIVQHQDVAESLQWRKALGTLAGFTKVRRLLEKMQGRCEGLCPSMFEKVLELCQPLF